MMRSTKQPYLSAFLTSLPLDFESGIRTLHALGFTHVDLVALGERPPEHPEVLAETGLIVSCGAIGRGLAEGYSLEAAPVTVRRAALEQIKRQLADIARLGGSYAYLVPPKDSSAEALARFSEACALLADFAAGCMVRLAIEHSPGTALPSAAAVLDWLQHIGHANLGLLLDIGHCLLSNEHAPTVVGRAKDRLFYVHLDDNDGLSDLHWPLLTGRLTEELLRVTLESLRREEYAGGLSLELRAENAEVAEGLQRGRDLLQTLLENA